MSVSVAQELPSQPCRCLCLSLHALPAERCSVCQALQGTAEGLCSARDGAGKDTPRAQQRPKIVMGRWVSRWTLAEQRALEKEQVLITDKAKSH